MATLQTPSVLPITPFDPSKEYNIEFIYKDAQSVKNRAVITDNETGNIVYDSTQSTGNLFHTLPANTLTAGNKYLVQIQVFDSDNNSSNLSDAVLFLCLTTPLFGFKNISNGDIYKEATINLELYYSQSEGEQLKNYQFIQYNISRVQLSSSDVLYTNDNLAYTFYGLENNSTYYFRAIGETQNGISLDTGYIEINVQLTLAPIDATIELENDYENGVIRLKFNIKDVDYTLDGDDYSFSNGMVTLNDTSLTYDNGFSVQDNFSLFCQATKVALGTFLEMQDGLISLSTLKICDTYYCHLEVKNSDYNKFVKLPDAYYSGNRLILTTDGSYFTFQIIRKNGYYDLNIL